MSLHRILVSLYTSCSIIWSLLSVRTDCLLQSFTRMCHKCCWACRHKQDTRQRCQSSCRLLGTFTDSSEALAACIFSVISVESHENGCMELLPEFGVIINTLPWKRGSEFSENIDFHRGPDKSSLGPPTLLFNIHFESILPSMLRSFKRSLSFTQTKVAKLFKQK